MIDLSDPSLPAETVARALDLAPHPEGGHFRETWRDVAEDGGRGAGTAILFLLAAGEESRWHRVDAAELWLWQAGGPLELALPGRTLRLGPGVGGGAVLQGVVPKGVWQAARPLAAWTLVSCVVLPAFLFSGFEMAPEGWRPDA